jgi:hypothetical protein
MSPHRGQDSTTSSTTEVWSQASHSTVIGTISRVNSAPSATLPSETSAKDCRIDSSSTRFITPERIRTACTVRPAARRSTASSTAWQSPTSCIAPRPFWPACSLVSAYICRMER